MKHYNTSLTEQAKAPTFKKWELKSDPIKNTYKVTIDPKTNMKSLIKTGTYNAYEMTQQHAINTDIYSILAICNGDPDKIKKLSAQPSDFTDITQMPKSLFEAHQMITQATESFEKLPLEIRRHYNHNIHKFIQDIGSENFIKLLKPYGAKEQLEIVKNVTDAIPTRSVTELNPEIEKKVVENNG